MMRPFQNSKTFISFDNAQCRCFQTPQPTQQFFLTKKQLPTNFKTQKNKMEIPENIKQTLAKTNIKRSLKRMNSPPTNETVQTQRSVEVDENFIFKVPMLKQKQEKIFNNSYRSPISAYEIKKPTANMTAISFTRPYNIYNPHIKITSHNLQQQPYKQIINPQINAFATNHNSNSFKKIETSKISFNFLPTASKQDQSPFLKEQVSICKSLKSLQNPITFETEKKIPQTEKVSIKRMSDQIKIPKLQRKDSKFQCSDLGITQTLTKNSILYSGVNTSPQKTDIYDKLQTRQTSTGLKDYNGHDNKNQNTKISQTTILRQNTYKSFIKTKRSLHSDTNRSKIVIKKEKAKPVLSKMQDVEQIRSLADSDEDNDSDKQSVVLGRLKQYDQFKSTTLLRKNTTPAELQRSLQFIQNSNSVIMDSPSGQWKQQVQSEYNF